MAIAHSILTDIYYMLRSSIPYNELGSNYFDKRSTNATIRRAVQRIQRLGYTVTLEVATPGPGVAPAAVFS